MTRAGWVKHALVFVAAVVTVWLSGIVPVLVLKPKTYAGPAVPLVVVADVRRHNRLHQCPNSTGLLLTHDVVVMTGQRAARDQ